MLALIDYETSNIGSVLNMLKKAGCEAKVAQTPEEVAKADKIILPGVGSFDFCVNKFKSKNLSEVVMTHAQIKKKPILGICVGHQMLFEDSEEGKEKGLGLIPGHVIKFKLDNPNLKIPHMGWNYIQVQPENDRQLFSNFEEKIKFYFVHSYYAQCEEKYISAKTNYGIDFACAVQNENIFGVQFHPEKSHKFGLQLLKNFAEKV